MKKTITITLLISAMLFAQAYAQKKDKDEAVVTININGKEQDIDKYFEDWGEAFGKKVEALFEGDTKVNIDFEDDNLNISVNNLKFDMKDFAESVSKTVEEAVTHMNIELRDVDPTTLDDVHFNSKDGDEVEDMVRDIERKYHSKVENVDKMKIEIRKETMRIDMDATLENGKKVNKSRVFHND